MNKTYSEEFKKEVVEAYNNGVRPVDVIKQFNISDSCLYDWVVLYRKQGHFKKERAADYDQREQQKELKKIQLELLIWRSCPCSIESPREDKLAAGETIFGQYPLKTMCRVLGIDPSTMRNHHYRTIEKNQYERNNDILKEQIKRVFEESGKRYGSEKITETLKRSGFTVSKKKVRGLMKSLKISPQLVNNKGRLERKPNSNPYLRNRVKQDFRPKEPNKVWVGDITELSLDGVKLYLCVIIDLFSRKVIAYRLHYKNNINLVVNTFKDAFESRKDPEGLIFHSDRGCQYTSFEYRSLLKLLKAKSSFSDTANPYDNAVVEGFYSILKREETKRQRYNNLDEMTELIADYIVFYNTKRIHSFCGNIPPGEFEKQYYENLK